MEEMEHVSDSSPTDANKTTKRKKQVPAFPKRILRSHSKLRERDLEESGDLEVKCEEEITERVSIDVHVKEEAFEECGSEEREKKVPKKRGRKRKIKSENVEVVVVVANRRITRSSASKQREETSSVANQVAIVEIQAEKDTDKGQKNLVESDTGKKKTNSESLICSERDVPIRDGREKAKLDLKMSGEVEVKRRKRGSKPVASDQECDSEISRIHRGKVENKLTTETGVDPVSSPLSKDSKDTGASSSKKAVSVKREYGSCGNKRIEMAERSLARKKLRDKIKNMLINAGWKIDRRHRNGKNCLDSIYVTPEGYSHWSLLRAYRVLQSQYYDETDENEKPRSESDKVSASWFTHIPEEALSILKHPISQRRSKKEIEDSKLGIERDVIPAKVKKNASSKGKKRGRKGAVISEDKKTRQRKRSGLLVRDSSKVDSKRIDKYVPYVGKRTILSWLIDMRIVPEKAKVKYMNDMHTETLLDGHITREGIYCSCCKEIIPVSKFENHAGSKQFHPYQNIYVEEAGISLLQCQINAWKKKESKLSSFYMVDIRGDDPSDDTCPICGDGGDLICCDACPSTFHQSCLRTEMLPAGNWYCMNCTCRYCGVNSGKISKQNGEVVYPLISCSQCEKKFHQKCVPKGDATFICSGESCHSFCGDECKQLWNKLLKLVGMKKYLDAGFSSTIIRRFDEDLPNCFGELDQRVECNSKMAIAHSVMNECFLPIIDRRSGINMIHNVVYNCSSNFNRLNYHGFYTFILERDDEIISVASVRLCGAGLAEMPFIGTRDMYRRQGMCRRLMDGIESALCSLKIERLVIPAISEMVDTWTNIFGFKHLETSQKLELKSTNLVIFPATGMLLKSLKKEDSAEPCITSDRVDEHETESVRQHTPDEPDVNLQQNLEVPVATNITDSTREILPRCKYPEIAIDQDLHQQTELPSLDEHEEKCE